MRSTLPTLLLLLAGCRFDSSNDLLGTDSGLTIDAGGPATDAAVPASGFSANFEAWAVPASGFEEGFYKASESIGMTRNWFLRDFDGDGKAELLQTSDPSFSEVFKDEEGSYWKAFASEAGGFVAPFTAVRLPIDDVGTQGFYTLENYTGGRWDSTDMDGDGRLDLVLFVDPGTDQLWTNGSSLSWKVYRGTGSGFEPALAWTVPDLGAEQLKKFDHYGLSLGCWQIEDLNGDKIVDLVHSSDAGGPVSPWDSAADPNWHVYLGGNDGFATDWTKWSLPVPEHQTGFSVTELLPFWSMIDLEGDGVDELVQAAEYPGGTGPYYDGGVASWRRYDLEADGFALAARSWRVPMSATPFDAINKSSGSLQWSTIDIDGDGRLDLVHTANSAAETPSAWGSPNSDQWKVYLGTADGFAPEAIAWPLPDSGTEGGFYAVTVSDGDLHWTTTDIDGDGQVELIQTADPATGHVWLDDDGQPYWRIFRRATN